MIDSGKVLTRALALAALASLSACSPDTGSGSEPVETEAEGNGTLAAAIGDAPQLRTVAGAIVGADLNPVFDGVGSYTLLAPTDEAFAALGADGKALLEEENKPLLVAILRNHILPGHLRPDDIAKAIDAEGHAVHVKTLGGGEVTFSREGDTIMVTGPNSRSASFTGSAIAASNGVVIPIEAVLAPQ